MPLISNPRFPILKKKLDTFSRIGYTPFDEQLPIHQSSKNLIQIIGAEGSGKSQVTANEITACIPHCDLVYLIGETYVNPRKEFEYLRDNLLKLGAVQLNNVSMPKTGRCSMTTVTGCRIETLSTQEGASAVIATGEEADIYCLCEAGIIQSYSMLTACVRRATRNKGRVILSGTLSDNFGWYASLVDELRITNNVWNGETFTLPAWINTKLYPGGKDDPEILRLKELLPKDEFNRTIAAVRSTPPAIIFQDFSYSKNVRECPFDPAIPVTISFDPGYSVSAYAVGIFQFKDSLSGDEEILQIDEIYLYGHTHEMVIEVAKAREWWQNVDRIVSDIAARQHQASKSGEEVWRELTGHYVNNQSVGIMDGVITHQAALNRMYHDPSCKYTLDEYGKYRRPTDRDGNPTSDKPLDKDNHMMKAIAYMLVDRYGFLSEFVPQYSYISPIADYRG